jgi:hypothetical protein
MRYRFLLPLLAMPWALAAPTEHDAVLPKDEAEGARLKTSKPQTFCSSDDGKAMTKEPRIAVGWTGTYQSELSGSYYLTLTPSEPGCKGHQIYKSRTDGWNMNERGYVNDMAIQSWMPGDVDDRDYLQSGTFCLIRYEPDRPNCIKDSELFYVKEAETPMCIDVGLGEDGLGYGNMNWEKTYDHWASPRLPLPRQGLH